MASTQKVKFGGTTLATRFFDPSFGPREYSTLRRHPFGLKGELELRGKQGGQTIQVPVRVTAKNYKDISQAVEDIQSVVGTHDALSLVYNSGARRSEGEAKQGKCTLDAAVEVRQRRYMAFDTELNAGGWECVLMLIFRKLNPDD